MLFDCHTHLHFKEFDTDRQEVIADFQKQNISIINSTVDPTEIEQGLELSKHPNIYWTLGLAATNLDRGKFDDTLKSIEKYRTDIIGIGEIGIDYYWVKDVKSREIMKYYFEDFIEYSAKKDIPVVVHSRDAEIEVMDVLTQFSKPAMMHCYSGSTNLAKTAVDLGCLISIPASVTYSKPKKELVKTIPLENIVVETDSPYLSPTPRTRNTPKNVADAISEIAQIKNNTFEEIAEKTVINTKKFFRIQ